LEAIHPGLVIDNWVLRRIKTLRTGLEQTPWAGTKPDTIHYLGLLASCLAKDELTALMERLNLRSHQRTLLKQAYTIRRNAGAIALAEKNSRLYHLLATTSDEARLVAWLSLDDELAQARIIHFQTTLRDVEPMIDGHYLREEFQLPSGPIYRQILDALRDARLDGLVTTLADERALVEQLTRSL
jgi:tRNA nucleotidyltransferase (CCA-adding enzyme)